jgi:hypothetical protein
MSTRHKECPRDSQNNVSVFPGHGMKGVGSEKISRNGDRGRAAPVSVRGQGRETSR